jgi:hypothetical protein
MPVGIRLIRAASFDPETTRAMGQAYDAACAGVEQDNIAHRELIAKGVIEAARRGERDIAKLAAYAREKALEESPALRTPSRVRSP